MGQKVHPYILRIGINKNWRSRWFVDGKQYAKNIKEDYQIREHITKNFTHAAISYINIERLAEQIKIKVGSARPGVIIGRRGVDIDRLKEELSNITDKELAIDIIEIKNPTAEAQLIAQNIAFQLEKRIAFRRAVKRAIGSARQAGVEGIRIRLAGRLGGQEMSRRETYRDGSVPLQTFRAALDYGFAEAHTTAGVIGVKVWVNKGEIFTDRTGAERLQKS